MTMLALAMLLFAGGALTRAKAADGESVAIRMYLWDRTMMRQLTPYLEEKFPEIDFTFVPAYNTMDYYKDMVSRGDELPDLITCRRFSLNDAAALSPYLMDLSDTEVAGTFYTSYLDVNKEESGAIRWLPPAPRWIVWWSTRRCLIETTFRCPRITRSLCLPLMRSSGWGFMAFRRTGNLIIPVWNACRDARFPN